MIRGGGWQLWVLLLTSDFSGEGTGDPLQCSCLENPLDGEAWWAAVRGVAKSRTWLGNFTFTFHFHALEKAVATHSRLPAWRIPGTGEPGGLPSVGLHRVGHDWSDLAAAAAVTFHIQTERWQTDIDFHSIFESVTGPCYPKCLESLT